MEGTRPEKNRILKILSICLAVVAAGFLLFIFFHNARGSQTTEALGDNPDYPLPGNIVTAGEIVDSATLVENASAWDTHVVSFTGEAIGEIMSRGEMAWVHVNDDAYRARELEEGGALAGYNSGHAVWVSTADAKKISVFGDYSHSGDIVAVTGVFNAACREHGGDMDIHAVSLSIAQPGHDVSHGFDFAKALIALALCVAGIMLFVLQRVMARK